MFTKNQLEKYADVLIWAMKKARTGTFQKKNIVIVRYSIPALGLAEILHAKLLKIGMNPILRASLTSVMEKDFYDISNLVRHEPNLVQIRNATVLPEYQNRRIGPMITSKWLLAVVGIGDPFGIFALGS